MNEVPKSFEPYLLGTFIGAVYGFFVGAVRLSIESILMKLLGGFGTSISLSATMISAVEAGLALGFVAGPTFYLGFKRIPTKRPITKGVILMLEIYIFLEIAYLVFHLPSSPMPHLIYVVPFDIPSYVGFGIVLGYIYNRRYVQLPLSTQNKVSPKSFHPSTNFSDRGALPPRWIPNRKRIFFCRATPS